MERYCVVPWISTKEAPSTGNRCAAAFQGALMPCDHAELLHMPPESSIFVSVRVMLFA
jgi:hypothetical protein